ncbi:S8 family peptidase [Alienimonas sp. DA493]|uniref:S8 family peptidase n=1 Tax=Alienimonas sp. DA493 TaxID=3373605 RepID=UPI003754DC2B
MVQTFNAPEADSGPGVCTLPPDLVIGGEVEAAAVPDLWHIPKATYGPIWDAGYDGEGETVAICDTGYARHPDLPEPVEAESFIRGESVEDRHGHGTHCSGTAVGRNGLGFAPKAKLVIAKCLSNRGSGSTSAIAAAIRWSADVGATVISLSLGGGGYSRETHDAIKHAISKGCVVVCAAGNAGFNGRRDTISYPALYPEAICVGATARNGGIAGFSSGGRAMDVAFPGQSIISAGIRGNYVDMSGTSMACPGVSGTSAQVKGDMRRKGVAEYATTDQWREFWVANSEDRGAPGKDPSFGVGVPTASKIVESLAARELNYV